MGGRPCIVYSRPEPRRAFCHLFTTISSVIAPSPAIGGHPGGQISTLVAVVEFEDGNVGTISPDRIRLLDTAAEMEKYNWEMRPNMEGEQ